MAKLLQRNPWVLFLLLFAVRVTTTLPVLNALTASGFQPVVAKTISQLPTVLFLVGLVIWFGWWRQVGLTSTQWRSKPVDLLMVALPLLVPLIGMAFIDITLPLGYEIPWLLAEAAFVAVWEELYFRGILLHQFQVSMPRFAILGSALLFGLAHAGNGVAGAATSFVVVQTLWSFLSAFGLAAVRVRTGSLWPLILGHFLLDGLERLLVRGQATSVPTEVMALMLLVSLVLGAYGFLAMRKRTA